MNSSVTQLLQHQAVQLLFRIQQAMMNFPKFFIHLCASQSSYLVQFSSIRGSPGLSYLTLPPQTRFYLPCYCGHGINTQKHFCSPLFIFCEQIDSYPSLMRTLLPVYIRRMLKARPLICFAEPGAREDSAGEYLKTGKRRAFRGCLFAGLCTPCSR